MKKFRKIKADEIDVRVGTVSKKGVTLLLYKSARVDQDILDETVGCMNWQRKHSRDNANCIVSIYDQARQQWVEKEDTGTESFTEKEKGLASDSFKRACVNWGIGRELYSSPHIFVATETEEEQLSNGKKKYNMKNPFLKFYVSDIDYMNDKISYLVIYDNNGKQCFKFGSLSPENQYVRLLMEKGKYTEELHLAFNKMSMEDKRKEFERVKGL